jgi:hypothetical protein
MLVTNMVQVHEYGLAIMCASYRRLACADAQRMLGLQGTEPDQQLITLLEALGNRCSESSCACATCTMTYNACGMYVKPD